LHEGLIVTTDREKFGVICTEGYAYDVLRVTTEASRLALDARVSEEVDEAVIITSGEELTVV